MTLNKNILIFLSAAVPMTILDAFWLGFMAKRLYGPRIGHLMAQAPNWTAAIIFYFIYIAAILYFIVIPGLKSDMSLAAVAIQGALLGAFAYATYDLTNQATLKNWSWTVTLVDIIWGATLTATACAVSFYICKKYILNV
jgi:uncharacterized membrane protein